MYYNISSRWVGRFDKARNMSLALIAGAVGKAALGAGAGMAINASGNKSQLKQQGKLMEQQIAGQKDLGKFNQGLALDTWNKTNYSAQRKQMEKAGLNPGLMYGSAGSGGTTQGGSAGSVTGGVAEHPSKSMAMGMEYMLQAETQKAQVENIKADTKVKEAEVAAKGAGTEKTGAESEQVKQLTQNAKVQEEILKYEKEIKSIELNVAGRTQEQVVNQINAASESARVAMEKTKNELKVSDETWQEAVKQIKIKTVSDGVDILTKQLGMKVSTQQMSKVAQEMVINSEKLQNEWKGLDQKDKELKLKEMGVEFETSTPEQIKQWIGIVTQLIPLAGNGSRPIGFK
ncbi:MAG: DNA pilot protein [Microviridae sp.]|nr:MAG: DNA pilot protein [Microviridae sp.]